MALYWSSVLKNKFGFIWDDIFVFFYQSITQSGILVYCIMYVSKWSEHGCIHVGWFCKSVPVGDQQYWITLISCIVYGIYNHEIYVDGEFCGISLEGTLRCIEMSSREHVIAGLYNGLVKPKTNLHQDRRYLLHILQRKWLKYMYVHIL